MRNRNIEIAKLACFLNSLRPSFIRVVRRKNIERTKRKIGIAVAMKAMILKIIVHSQCRLTRSFDHLVCTGEHGCRYVEAKRLGGLQIDHHFVHCAPRRTGTCHLDSERSKPTSNRSHASSNRVSEISRRILKIRDQRLADEIPRMSPEIEKNARQRLAIVSIVAGMSRKFL
jgi:hypothetical protein